MLMCVCTFVRTFLLNRAVQEEEEQNENKSFLTRTITVRIRRARSPLRNVPIWRVNKWAAQCARRTLHASHGTPRHQYLPRGTHFSLRHLSTVSQRPQDELSVVARHYIMR